MDSVHCVVYIVVYTSCRDEIKTLTRLSDVTADEELTIGIVGRTGVGKSSLLNAIIDEPLLLPVSSFKACTSVPIRIRSISNSENKYQARIDFLTRKEWLDELKSLCEDIASYAISDKSSPRRRGDSVSKQIHDIAVAKLKAVYGDWAVHTSYEELKSQKTAVTEELLHGYSWKDIKATTVSLHDCMTACMHACIAYYTLFYRMPSYVVVVISHLSQ